MQSIVAVIAALCLAVPALSENAPCMDNVPGAANFDFDEFISLPFKYAMGTAWAGAEIFGFAVETTVKVGDSYHSTITSNRTDGSERSQSYLLEKIDGATFYKRPLIEGRVAKGEFSMTIFAFKPAVYAQFLVCGLGNANIDIRFAVVFPGVELTAELEAELLANDSKFGFKGELVGLKSPADKSKNEEL